MQVKVSICTSDQLPLSEPAKVVKDILTQLAHDFAADHGARGIKVVARPARRR
jgi:LysR family nitrogen assimilation transcriptional regulator